MRTRPLIALAATAAAFAGGATLATARDDTPGKEKLAVTEGPPPFFMHGGLTPFLPEGDLADQLAEELDVDLARVRTALKTIQDRHMETMAAARPPLGDVLMKCRKGAKRCPAIRVAPRPLPALPRNP